MLCVCQSVITQVSTQQVCKSSGDGVHSRAVVAHVVADAVAKAQAQAAEEQAARDAAKAEYESELASVSTDLGLPYGGHTQSPCSPQTGSSGDLICMPPVPLPPSTPMAGS